MSITKSKNDYCLIMAGGLGARFWPMSKVTHPKQFIDILGTGRTLIQQTYDRFLKNFYNIDEFSQKFISNCNIFKKSFILLLIKLLYITLKLIIKSKKKSFIKNKMITLF